MALGGSGGGVNKDVVIRIESDVSDFTSGIATAQAGLSSFTSQAQAMSATVGNAFTSVGTSVNWMANQMMIVGGASSYLSSMMTGAFNDATAPIMEYEKQLSGVLSLLDSARGGAEAYAQTSSEISSMAKTISEQSLFSMSQVTEGMYTLGQAGVDTAEKMRDYLVPISQLATGQNADLGQTINTVMSVMNAYGMEASQTAQITNLFAKACTDSLTTVDDLTSGMKYLTPVMSAAGVSIEDAVTAWTMLNDLGYTGENSGRILRDMMNDIQSPTAEATEVMARHNIQLYDNQDVLNGLQATYNTAIDNEESLTAAKKLATAALSEQKEVSTDLGIEIRKINEQITEFKQAESDPHSALLDSLTKEKDKYSELKDAASEYYDTLQDAADERKEVVETDTEQITQYSLALKQLELDIATAKKKAASIENPVIKELTDEKNALKQKKLNAQEEYQNKATYTNQSKALSLQIRQLDVEIAAAKNTGYASDSLEIRDLRARKEALQLQKIASDGKVTDAKNEYEKTKGYSIEISKINSQLATEKANTKTNPEVVALQSQIDSLKQQKLDAEKKLADDKKQYNDAVDLVDKQKKAVEEYGKAATKVDKEIAAEKKVLSTQYESQLRVLEEQKNALTRQKNAADETYQSMSDGVQGYTDKITEATKATNEAKSALDTFTPTGIKSLPEVLQEFANGNLTQAEFFQIFGKQSGAGVQKLVNNISGYDSRKTSLEEGVTSGEAAIQAGLVKNSAYGVLKSADNAMEATTINAFQKSKDEFVAIVKDFKENVIPKIEEAKTTVIADSIQPLQDAVDTASELVDKFNNLSPAIKEAGTAAAVFAGIWGQMLAPLVLLGGIGLKIIADMFIGVGKLITPTEKLAIAVEKLAAAQEASNAAQLGSTEAMAAETTVDVVDDAFDGSPIVNTNTNEKKTRAKKSSGKYVDEAALILANSQKPKKETVVEDIVDIVDIPETPKVVKPRKTAIVEDVVDIPVTPKVVKPKKEPKVKTPKVAKSKKVAVIEPVINDVVDDSLPDNYFDLLTTKNNNKNRVYNDGRLSYEQKYGKSLSTGARAGALTGFFNLEDELTTPSKTQADISRAVTNAYTIPNKVPFGDYKDVDKLSKLSAEEKAVNRIVGAYFGLQDAEIGVQKYATTSSKIVTGLSDDTSAKFAQIYKNMNSVPDNDKTVAGFGKIVGGTSKDFDIFGHSVGAATLKTKEMESAVRRINTPYGEMGYHLGSFSRIMKKTSGDGYTLAAGLKEIAPVAKATKAEIGLATAGFFEAQDMLVGKGGGLVGSLEKTASSMGGKSGLIANTEIARKVFGAEGLATDFYKANFSLTGEAGLVGSLEKTAVASGESGLLGSIKKLLPAFLGGGSLVEGAGSAALALGGAEGLAAGGTAAAGSTGALATALALLTSPLVVVGVAVAALAVIWFTNFHNIQERVQGFIDWFDTNFGGIFDTVSESIDKILSGFEGMWNGISEIVGGIIDGDFEEFLLGWADLGGGILTILEAVVEGTGTIMIDLGIGIVGILTNMAGGVYQAAIYTFSHIPRALMGVLQGVENLLFDAGGWVLKLLGVDITDEQIARAKKNLAIANDKIVTGLNADMKALGLGGFAQTDSNTLTSEMETELRRDANKAADAIEKSTNKDIEGTNNLKTAKKELKEVEKEQRQEILEAIKEQSRGDITNVQLTQRKIDIENKYKGKIAEAKRGVEEATVAMKTQTKATDGTEGSQSVLNTAQNKYDTLVGNTSKSLENEQSKTVDTTVATSGLSNEFVTMGTNVDGTTSKVGGLDTSITNTLANASTPLAFPALDQTVVANTNTQLDNIIKKMQQIQSMGGVSGVASVGVNQAATQTTTVASSSDPAGYRRVANTDGTPGWHYEPDHPVEATDGSVVYTPMPSGPTTSSGSGTITPYIETGKSIGTQITNAVGVVGNITSLAGYVASNSVLGVFYKAGQSLGNAVATGISNFLIPHSPVKEGPLTELSAAGEKLISQLTTGIENGTPELIASITAAANKMMEVLNKTALSYGDSGTSLATSIANITTSSSDIDTNAILTKQMNAQLEALLLKYGKDAVESITKQFTNGIVTSEDISKVTYLSKQLLNKFDATTATNTAFAATNARVSTAPSKASSGTYNITNSINIDATGAIIRDDTDITKLAKVLAPKINNELQSWKGGMSV